MYKRNRCPKTAEWSRLWSDRTVKWCGWLVKRFLVGSRTVQTYQYTIAQLFHQFSISALQLSSVSSMQSGALALHFVVIVVEFFRLTKNWKQGIEHRSKPPATEKEN